MVFHGLYPSKYSIYRCIPWQETMSDRLSSSVGSLEGKKYGQVTLIIYWFIGWWFGTFFIFHNICDNPSTFIFFRGVETTNQFIYWDEYQHMNSQVNQHIIQYQYILNHYIMVTTQYLTEHTYSYYLQVHINDDNHYKHNILWWLFIPI